MHPRHVTRTICSLLALLLGGIAAQSRADDFDNFLRPLLVQKCTKCHGGKKPKGEINFKRIVTAKQFFEQPELIKEMMEAVDAGDMPPEAEPQLDEKTRTQLLATLKAMLRQATAGQTERRIQIRRLNRFQYNNSLRDLFQLNRDVFELPEKLMTRRDNYLHPESGKMPGKVNVSCESLNPQAGFRNVKAFPKDLRASHGFDNQASQLTLSPLLLDAFLRLSVSILESPDFNEQNVGIWNEFFKEPAGGTDRRAEVQHRLGPFLKIAFRGPVDGETLNRYTAYALSKIKQGMSFTDSMKKVASAALSSPMFLYRSAAGGKADQYELAAKLSFFLWASCPDLELLRLAERGDLSKPAVLNKTIERMFADPKIERFLDTFPAQWMQLENILAVTPDPQKNRLFSLDKKRPASLQMVLEPLLLFDAVFIEDRPIVELISPNFSYRSEFLKTWYTTDLKPPKVDTRKIVEQNRLNQQRRTGLQATIKTSQAELDGVIQSVRVKLLAARNKNPGAKQPVDLKPYAAWEFNGDLKDAVNSLDLSAHGKVEYKDGMVVLKGAYLLSKNLPFDLKAKTLEVWCKVHDLNQRGGGVMGIQGPGDFFDTIVLGERKPRHWISGSNGFSRTEDFGGSTPETKTNQMLHLTMVYAEDGTTTLYRDGKPYGKPFRKAAATFPKNRSAVIFGLRHLPPGGNKFLAVSVDKARFYNRALTAGEVAASSGGDNLYVSDKELLKALTPEQRTKQETLSRSLEQSKAALKRIPPRRDPGKAEQNAQRKFDDEMRGKLRSQTFERVTVADPRYGGVITNAAMLSMTSGPKRTHPIARGVWIIEVIFNDPPPPPPNDVPPLSEEQDTEKLTIREKFAVHRNNPSCAGCHSKIDPLGFALENFGVTGRWRDKYENGRDVDSSGKLLRKHEFDGVVKFKEALVKENRRFAKAFSGHLLRFALSRELTAVDSITLDEIVAKTEKDGFKLKAIIREVMLSETFRGPRNPAPASKNQR
ncbi:MAG: DUF1588 domain-containing protein [Planctomycetes bacterium]|nr:DUF1588 domain-containing protein [Planctomycetota bacterium]